MAPPPGTQSVTLKFDPDPGFVLSFDGLSGYEELGRPFLFELDLSSGTPKGDLSAMLGGRVTMSMLTPGDSDPRYLNAIIARAMFVGLSGGTYRYKIEMRPWIWLLTRSQDCMIFQNMSAFDIISKVFRDAGFTDFEDKRQSNAGSAELEYCVQYRETSFDFVTRLMEEYGIYYYFTHTKTQHMLVLADDPNSHAALPGDPIPFRFDVTEHRTVDDHVWDFSADLRIVSGKVAARDYNFETPTADLTSKTMDPDDPLKNKYEVYDYPGPYKTTEVGTKLTDVRMQGLAAQRKVYRGMSNSRALFAGCKPKLAKHKDTALDRDYLIVRAEYTMELAEGLSDVSQGENVDTYRCAFTAIPGDTHYRLQPWTPRPMIRGPQTAKVVGESGEEITTDKYARIKVQFYWDRVGTNDENSSCWIRVSQASAGIGFGSLYIPRIGQEVIVEFLEGNPDRPIVTGQVYNAVVTVPYPLPDKKTTSTTKTSSSKGGGGSNELRFDDTKDKEEVFFQAQYDYNVVVLNSHDTKIKKDSTTTIQQGNHSLTISQGNQSTTVSAGSSSFEAAQSIELKVGPNSIKIDATGVTINGAQLQFSATGTAKMSASGPMTLQGATVSIN